MNLEKIADRINMRVCCLIGVMGGLTGTISNIFMQDWPATAWSFGSACWAFLGWRLSSQIDDLKEANEIYNRYITGYNAGSSDDNG